MKIIKNLIWIGSIFILIILDLLTKYLAIRYFENTISVIPDFLNFSLSYNKGIAFSIPIPNIVMIFIIPFLLGLTVWFIARACVTENFITKVALILLISGGLGNFINRIWTASVIDFIDFSFWPSFNLADSYLTLGVFLIFIFYGKIKQENSKH